MSWLAGLTMVVMAAGASFWPLPDLSTHREVKAEIEVHAAPQQVWTVLTDFAAYTIWNPYISPAKGQARPGTQLELTLHGGGGSMTYEPTVVTAQPNRELSWSGRMIGAVMFERVQTFTIVSLGPHRVRLVAEERFKGLAVPLARSITDDAAHGLDIMSKALRTRAELWEFAITIHR